MMAIKEVKIKDCVDNQFRPTVITAAQRLEPSLPLKDRTLQDLFQIEHPFQNMVRIMNPPSRLHTQNPWPRKN